MRVAIGCAGAFLLASASARAACPHDAPGDPVCDPYVAILMPTVTAEAYFPEAAGLYWAMRLATSHLVFLAWSYPLWRRVFASTNVGPNLQA